MKSNKERQAGATDDSSTKDQDMQVCQHSSKPNVSGRRVIVNDASKCITGHRKEDGTRT